MAKSADVAAHLNRSLLRPRKKFHLKMTIEDFHAKTAIKVHF